MDISPVTNDIWMLRFPVVQSYAVRLPDGWALVDTGLAGYGEQILDALAGLGAAPGDIREIVLTHAHMDHTGSLAELAEATGARVLAGAGDAAVVRGERPEPEPVFLDWERELHASVLAQIPGGPQPARPCRVDRELREGDTLDWGQEVRVVEVPGHTPGSIALYLPSSRVLFSGDTIANVRQLMLGVFNTDRQAAIASFRKQGALDVDIALFGHGEPITSGAGAALRAAAAEAG
jgi:glyoxylase-like metal-dependent hydrolase (beta-lactamase superfamily II)